VAEQCAEIWTFSLSATSILNSLGRMSKLLQISKQCHHRGYENYDQIKLVNKKAFTFILYTNLHYLMGNIGSDCNKLLPESLPHIICGNAYIPYSSCFSRFLRTNFFSLDYGRARRWKERNKEPPFRMETLASWY